MPSASRLDQRRRARSQVRSQRSRTQSLSRLRPQPGPQSQSRIITTGSARNPSSPRPQFLSQILRILFFGALTLILILVLVFFQHNWDWKSPKNFILVSATIDDQTKQIYLAHIEPQNNSIEIAALPAEMSVEVLGGYGTYPLKSVYPLLKIDKRNDQFAVAALSFGLKTSMDEVWKTNSTAVLQQLDAQAASSDFQKNVPKALFSDLLFYKIQSELTLSDRVWLYRFFSQLRPDQVTVHVITTPQDWSKVQAKFGFPDHAEDCSIAIINTTTVAGMGSAVTNVLDGSDFSVLRLTDTPAAQQTTQLFVQDGLANCTDIEQHIQKILPFSLQPQISKDVFAQYRANIVLFLGNDFAKEFHPRKN